MTAFSKISFELALGKLDKICWGAYFDLNVHKHRIVKRKPTVSESQDLEILRAALKRIVQHSELALDDPYFGKDLKIVIAFVDKYEFDSDIAVETSMRSVARKYLKQIVTNQNEDVQFAKMKQVMFSNSLQTSRLHVVHEESIDSTFGEEKYSLSDELLSGIVSKELFELEPANNVARQDKSKGSPHCCLVM